MSVKQWFVSLFPSQRSRPRPPGPGRPLPVCFEADFASAKQWVEGRSWAYPDGGPVNPGDNKLDHLVTDPAFCREGVFRAERRPHGLWNTGLLTTEGSEEGFQVRTGDVLDVRVRLPEGTGAWPSVWTWRDGGNEVDVFEYHPDNPDLLELSNHVGGASHDYRDASLHPGAWVSVRTEFGARSVVWWVNDRRVFADGRGVGRGWEAYLIVNLSVSAGRYHPAPDRSRSALSFDVGRLRVHRP
ncbi:family 16 glycosylhydrolase [Streptomyces sp. 8L]|uniref:family 16 glycosylhydrolase n=1 Tax=Streptomyces sp. 8L TaxID=2877242 RepID=UPI001CD5DE24|nr:family 16 glycosylhydrolase [Streptomyces sp. 8L]MCA1218636.1 family 16 glycosylhydrolase [Streptomyces sp. 8L]